MRRRPPIEKPAATAAGTIGLCVKWVRHRLQIRRNAEILSALDDRLLADIGLARNEVRRVARLGRLPGWR
jgi:uncharacterized protein YjiS (DUF1127 family)